MLQAWNKHSGYSLFIDDDDDDDTAAVIQTVSFCKY